MLPLIRSETKSFRWMFGRAARNETNVAIAAHESSEQLRKRLARLEWAYDMPLPEEIVDRALRELDRANIRAAYSPRK